jgi:hypothetical protein
LCNRRPGELPRRTRLMGTEWYDISAAGRPAPIGRRKHYEKPAAWPPWPRVERPVRRKNTNSPPRVLTFAAKGVSDMCRRWTDRAVVVSVGAGADWNETAAAGPVDSLKIRRA